MSSREDEAVKKPLSDFSPASMAAYGTQAWDAEEGSLPAAAKKGEEAGINAAILEGVVKLGYALAVLMFGGIFLTVLLVAWRQRRQSLSLRAELDIRGESNIRFQELVAWSEANGATGMNNVAMSFFDKDGGLYQVKGLTRALPRHSSTRISSSGEQTTPWTILGQVFKDLLSLAPPEVAAPPEEKALQPTARENEPTDDDISIVIPSTVILSEASAQFQNSAFAQATPPELRFTVYLASQRHKIRLGGWQASFWSPIIRLLPSALDYSAFHPYYADPELLVSFSVLPVAFEIRQQQLRLQTTWDRHGAEWRKLASAAGVGALSFEDYKWAATALKAHSSQLYHRSQGRHLATVVPLLSLVGNSAPDEANVDWNFVDDTQEAPEVRLKLSKGARPGEELLESKTWRGLANDAIFEQTGDILKGNPTPVKQLSDVECDLLAIRLKGGIPAPGHQRPMRQNFQALAHEHCSAAWNGGH
eukprot:TRINITY_DN65307_c0_g2_i1.p1 TRINITY_DN65307_c0_g2~~TRINITY_DN65307_c0_g2_i1.p1  ORF type:complete len:476 (-),score=122.91 TRINITY_DN65307_c0_g2_i1:81-1508(-)